MYIVSVLHADDKLDIGKQHLRSGWSGALEIAVQEAKDNGATDEDEIRSALEADARYDDPVGTWAVVIGQADTIEN